MDRKTSEPEKPTSPARPGVFARPGIIGLLVGLHGTGKSYLLNRLADALEHRHYNASLLSFDDLVGYPLPNGADRSNTCRCRLPAGGALRALRYASPKWQTACRGRMQREILAAAISPIGMLTARGYHTATLLDSGELTTPLPINGL